MATLIERLEAALLTIENSATKQDEVIDGGINDFITTGFGNIRSLANAINIISSINVLGAWATSTSYTLKDLVVESGTYYICLDAHTSGVFATDLTAKKWAVYQFNKETVTTTATTFNVDKESTVLLDTSSNNITANLPDATLIPGISYIFKKINASNVATIDPFGAQTIDGSPTFNLNSNNDYLIIQSDGSNWVVTSKVNFNIENGIIASTTQTQAGATELVSDINQISTVANDGDSIKLKAGLSQTVIHDGANLLWVWPPSGGDLGKGVDTKVVISTGTIVEFKAYNSTNHKITSKFSTIDHTIHVSTGAGHGSTNAYIRRIETTVKNTGTAITVTQSSTDGTSFTVQEDGLYSISYNDGYSASGTTFGISKNSSQLNTQIGSITASDRLAVTDSGTATFRSAVSTTAYLMEGDIIRPHTNSAPDVSNVNCWFSITKIK